MTSVEIIIKDDQGNEITKLQKLNLELGGKSLAAIEVFVEKLKRKMLPEITKELLGKGQEEFTLSKKKRKLIDAMELRK